MNAVANETVTIVAFEFTGYAYRAKGDDGVIYGTGRRGRHRLPRIIAAHLPSRLALTRGGPFAV
jgi:hypothetical protein